MRPPFRAILYFIIDRHRPFYNILQYSFCIVPAKGVSIIIPFFIIKMAVKSIFIKTLIVSLIIWNPYFWIWKFGLNDKCVVLLNFQTTVRHKVKGNLYILLR